MKAEFCVLSTVYDFYSPDLLTRQCSSLRGFPSFFSYSENLCTYTTRVLISRYYIGSLPIQRLFTRLMVVGCTAVNRFREVGQRVHLLRGQRLCGRRPGIHILWDAHQRRVPGAQRVRLPGKRARRPEITSGSVPLRSAVRTPQSIAPDALAARPRRVRLDVRPGPFRRTAPRIRPHL